MLDPDKALAGLSEEIDHVSDSELIEIGEFAMALVITRTKSGLDADGRPFVPYTDEYAKTRAKRGLSKRVDLAVTGHMLGSMTPVRSGVDEVTVTFNSPLEAAKAAAINYGVDKSGVSVSSHSRSVYINAKTGRRVSHEEVRRDKKRKNKRVAQRTEAVSSHSRRMKMPQREFLDVRRDAELDAIASVIGDKMLSRIEKTVK